jgi:glutathione S-transferase
MLALYDLPHSPYCLPVKRILEAAGQPYEVIDVPNWDRSKVIELTEGAYYQVPVLQHGERVVYETGTNTQDVAQYLDATFAGGTLFPAQYAGLQDILVDYLDNEVEGATFRCTDAFYVPSITDLVSRTMLIRHKERKFGRGCVEQWQAQIESLRAGTAPHFARFDAMVQQRPFLLGDKPVYADFLLYGIIGNYTWQGWNSLPAGLTALEAWRERIRDHKF